MLKGKATFLKFFWFLVRIEDFANYELCFLNFLKSSSHSRDMKLSSTQIYVQKTTHLSIF